MAHGSKHFDVLAPRSALYQGPFGRLCPDLPAWSPPGVAEADIDDFFLDIANELMLEVPNETPGNLANPQRAGELDSLFGSSIPAGYTYFGQFVDHDITFDPASSLMRRNDPNGLLNFRTPRLDLDNIYGAGPDDQPYLYNEDKITMAIDFVGDDPFRPDLPRYKGRALIGDMRNDENSMVSQLQLAFLLAHNELVRRARNDLGLDNGEAFEAARKTLRWLYQHIVWNDFVKRIVVNEVYDAALKLEETPDKRKRWTCGLEDVYSWKHQPFMPVEFSVAAYRFGHSMVRNAYQTNFPVRGINEFAPIFDNSAAGDPDDLRGFRPIKPENMIQWDWFLPMGSIDPVRFPQMARKIDTKLANALAFLHEGAPGDPMNVLAFRNLKRGWTFGLPSGTDMAKKWCLNPLKLQEGEPDSLWYYILREAQGNGGATMGRVGSVIVSSVFAGLLKGDPNSWINVQPDWKPADDPLLHDGDDNMDETDGSWKLASIIRIAGIKADGIGIDPELDRD